MFRTAVHDHVGFEIAGGKNQVGNPVSVDRAELR